MHHRSSARFLAPIALVAVLVAVVVIVAGSASDNGSSTTSAPTSTGPAKARARRQGRAQTRPARARYRVVSGDTFGRIAEKTGVDVAVLRELNPGVDPQALTVGQILRLRP